MSELMNSIRAKASALSKRIVLAEGEEARIIKAALKIKELGIAESTLLGNADVAKSVCPDLDLSGLNFVDYKNSDKKDEYANLLYELRKAKGLTLEDAYKLVEKPLYYGCLMVKAGDADGLVGGSVTATSEVLRPALQIIKTAKGVKTVSSCFIMVFPESKQYGDNGVLVFGDCAVNINPTAEQLADIAVSTASSAKVLAGIEQPKVSMLSFSTKGSAKGPEVEKVQQATALAKENAPDLCLDGELQLDASIVPEVGELKAKGSSVAGHANVLIFPSLEAGNIGYKLAQRFGHAEAVGPICQGFAGAVNDLSRGCSSEDVVDVVAITVLQAAAL